MATNCKERHILRSQKILGMMLFPQLSVSLIYKKFPSQQTIYVRADPLVQ
jgi:hypothetical protein